MVKVLINSGAIKSVINKEASNGLKMSPKREIQRRKTAAGRLATSSKTKNSQFSLPELHANKKSPISYM